MTFSSGSQTPPRWSAAAAQLRARHENPVVVIGNFDGLHRGHQDLLSRARSFAGTRPIGVVTFHPHPRKFFHPPHSFFELTSSEIRNALLSTWADFIFTLHFEEIAALSAESFVRDVLVRALAVSGVVVAEGFRFGWKRQGDVSFLKKMEKEGLFSTLIAPPLKDEKTIISSSLVREALSKGEAETARRLLGRPWSVREKVIHGQKRGRTLGYPTVNMRLPDSCSLKTGVYAVCVTPASEADAARIGAFFFKGVASFGRRPVFDAQGERLLEAYLFDFDREIYGASLDVFFVSHLRDEMNFSSIERLIYEINGDVIRSNHILESENKLEYMSLRCTCEVKNYF